MDVTETPSQVEARPSQEWVHRLIALLDTAAHQLRNEDPAVHFTILSATRFLQQQVGFQPARPRPLATGRLLAWQVRAVRDYVDANLTNRIFVADLSAAIHLSESHFSRVFKRTFAEPPYAFVLRRRLELASLHMVETDAPLSDIALRCGFADQAHLTRAFRRATGSSPATWRRKMVELRRLM